MTTQSDTLGALAKALSLAQAELQPAKFDAVNPFLKNRYASLGSVIDAARPVMAANGLAVSQLVSNADGAIGVETVLMHESGEWLASSISLPLGDERGKSSAQVAGSIITYLRRYALASALGIYADEDTDGHQPEPARKPLADRPTTLAEQLDAEQTDWVGLAGLATDAASVRSLWGQAKAAGVDADVLAAIVARGKELA